MSRGAMSYKKNNISIQLKFRHILVAVTTSSLPAVIYSTSFQKCWHARGRDWQEVGTPSPQDISWLLWTMNLGLFFDGVDHSGESPTCQGEKLSNCWHLDSQNTSSMTMTRQEIGPFFNNCISFFPQGEI